MTQTRKEALTDLLAKVEAGEDDPGPRYGWWEGIISSLNWLTICEIMDTQSLDAAKALHEAVLPGWITRHHQAAPDRWHFYVSRHVADRDTMPGLHDFCGIGEPARAWLIAILKALIAQEPDQ